MLMKKKLTIALVAHDRRKADMIDWVKVHAPCLSQHRLVCTGTTGRLVAQAFADAGIDADVECMNSEYNGWRCRDCGNGGEKRD